MTWVSESMLRHPALRCRARWLRPHPRGQWPRYLPGDSKGAAASPESEQPPHVGEQNPLKRRQPPFGRLGLHDGRMRLGFVGNAVKNLVKVFYGAQMQAPDKAIIARNLVAVRELGDIHDQFLDRVQLAGKRPNTNDRL